MTSSGIGHRMCVMDVRTSGARTTLSIHASIATDFPAVARPAQKQQHNVGEGDQQSAKGEGGEPGRIGPSRPEAAILVILENTSGTGWLLLTIAHARNDVPLR
ncbi:hypothetical protein BSL82_19135 (plasmid) [Tardibacter chloracetimidivorans]|uniref:Uncharacterized protein n=1 Tax=Tardibacter chloracetimidivorans TaxID=1921510 RepID=A0A1L4A0X9_9SPHN|nr:hypothetical protein BSL82_19135 [Tardibacter chloracetimidivorans]